MYRTGLERGAVPDYEICLYTCDALYEDGEKPMDIILWITENSQLILMMISIILAVVARYLGAKATLLGEAMQSLVDLQQEFLNSIRDNVISAAELDQILQKIQAASAALKAALDAFIQPVPITEKFAMVFGGGQIKNKIAEVKAQTQMMQVSRMGKTLNVRRTTKLVDG